MRNVQITINQEVADFYSQEDLAPRVTKQLFNAENITQVSGDYAININFPITQNNRKIFSYIDMLQTNKSFYDLRLLPTVITLDGDTLIEGNLQVKQITKNGFECTLVSKGINWMGKMKNNSIRDVDLRSIYFSGNKSIQAPINWDLSVQASGNVVNNILTIDQRGNYNTFTQFGVILDGDIVTGPGIPTNTRIVKQLTRPDYSGQVPGFFPILTNNEDDFYNGGQGTYLLSQDTGNVLPVGGIYSFKPYWWDETEGHYDIFESTSIGDLGKDELSGEYDFAMPLVSYGNFKYPYILGYIRDNPLNSNYQLVVLYTSVELKIGDEISSIYPNIFLLSNPSVTVPINIISQDFGTPGYVGIYGLTFFTLNQGYGDADNPIIFTTIKTQNGNALFPARDSAIQDGYFFYNNIRQGLTNISLFPAPYLGRLVAGMFNQYGKNVAGNFFSDESFKNLILPFTSSEDAPWNWGILARLAVEYQHIQADPEVQPGSGYNLQPFNFGANTFTITRAGHKLQFCRINTSKILEVDPLNSRTGPTPAIVTANEKYLYDQTFFDDFGILNTPSHETFKCVVDGKYRFSYYLKDFGAFPFNLIPEDWNRDVPLGIGKPPRTNDRFFFIVVKRTDNNFTGVNGAPFIDYTGSVGNYITSDGNLISAQGTYIFPDSQVCYVQAYDTTTGYWNVLDSVNIGIDILFDVNVKAGETLELMFVAGNAEDYTSPGIAQPGFSLRYAGGPTPSVSSQMCYPISYTNESGEEQPFDTLLNPAKFLPDIAQDDFLKSVMNSFNLFLYPDNFTDTIHINDFDNNFLPSGVSEDWSEKCSVEDPNIVLSPLNTFKKVNFYEVTDSNDVHTNMIQQPIITVENDSSNFTDIKNIEILFSATDVKSYQHSSAFGGYLFPDNIQYDDTELLVIPTMSDADVYRATVFELEIGDTAFSYDFNVRLLKYLGLQYYKGGIETLVIPGPPPDVVYTGYTYIEDVYLDTTPAQTPGDPDIKYKILPMATNVSFQYNVIWKKYLNLVTNNTKIDIPVWLLSTDINSIDLRKPVKIGNDTYIINRVFQFSPLEQKRTRVELFKKK